MQREEESWMTELFICIHGHFYQPPRESPWLEAIEIQDSAFPYHDLERAYHGRMLRSQCNVENLGHGRAHRPKGPGSPCPKSLSVATDLSLNAKLRRALQGEWVDPQVIPTLLEEARLAGATLDVAALALLVAASIEHLAEEILERPDDISLLERFNEAAKLVRTLPFEVNLWKTQNICYRIIRTSYPSFKEKAEMEDKNAQEWMSHCAVLAEALSIRVP